MAKKYQHDDPKLPKHSRPGTRLRGAMAPLYDKRSHARATLTLHYSPKSMRDVKIFGEHQLLHFLHCEFDPDITAVNYEPNAITTKIVGSTHASMIHAIVETKAGITLWRHIADNSNSLPEEYYNLDYILKSQQHLNIKLQSICIERLTENPMILHNSLRMLAWISAARHWPLTTIKTELLQFVKRKRTVFFSDVLDLGIDRHRALYGAAMLTLASTGIVESDLHQFPLSANTEFTKHGD